MIWKKAESTVTPKTPDVQETTVYLRKNVEEIAEHEVDGQQFPVTYRYDEAQLTMSEYAAYCAEESSAKADYIAMMLEVE